jgi:hypothetical protein
MFCGLCTDPCPTDCIHMGNNHDLSAFDRSSMVIEFTELAKEGHQTPQPLWLQRDNLPDWAQQRKAQWLERATPKHEKMIDALSASEIPKPAKKAPAKPDAAAKPGAAAKAKPAPAEKPAKDPEAK